MDEYAVPAQAVYAAPAPLDEHVAPAPAVYVAPAPVDEYVAPVIAAPAPVDKYIAPAPAVYAAPAPVEYIAPAPAVYAAPAPSVEYIAPAPAVYAAPAPVVEFSPVPAVIQAPTPVVEYLAPVPSDVQAPPAVVESVAQCHAPVFPLSPDASDLSSPEDVYTRSWESSPVPIKSLNTGRECGTLEPGKRQNFRLVAETGWWVMPSGFARRLLCVGMCGGSSDVLGSFLRYEQRVCLLVEMLARPCGTRLLEQASWWRRFGSWQREGTARVLVVRVSGEGAGGRVAVRSVLEDHETAVLELERVVSSIEDRISECEHKVSGVCCDFEKRQLVVAELEGNFERFMVHHEGSTWLLW